MFDLVFIRRPLIIFSILFISAIAMYFAGSEYNQMAIDDYNNAKQTLTRNHNKLKKQSSDAQIINEYLEKYNKLKDKGYIGEERRLSWIESVKETNEKLKLPKLNYVISPQTDFTRLGMKKSKTVKSLSSVMDLDINILHEGDLFDVFSELRRLEQSRFVIDSCRLRKINSDELNMREANFSALCAIRWVNIEVKKK